MSAITRTQFREALYDLLVAQKTATPTLLRKVERFRPGGFGELPVGWIGTISERLSYDAGTRLRVFTADVPIAAGMPSDQITDSDPFDQLEDALVERFTAASSVIPNTILELTEVADGDIEARGPEVTTFYRGLTLTAQLRVWEGRR